MPLGAAVPVGACVGVHRLSVRLASSGRFSAWRSAAVGGWAAGSDRPLQGVTFWACRWAGSAPVLFCLRAGPLSSARLRRVHGLLGWRGASAACGLGAAQGVSPVGVRWGRPWPGRQACHFVWRVGFPRCCGCCRCLCVDACGVARGCLCAGWAWGDVPQAPSFPPRLLGGFLQAFEDIRVVLGCVEFVGVNSLGMERIGQHGFRCGLWHPAPRQLEAAVLRRHPAGPADQALDGGLCPGPLSQLPELRVGPALPQLSMGGAVALGGDVGVDWCAGVPETGGGGGPRGVLVVLCRGGAWGAGSVCGPVGTGARSPLRGCVGTRGNGGSRASAGRW